MKFVDLKKQYNNYKSEIDDAIKNVIENTAFINGPDVKELEKELAAFSGSSNAIGCSSGTDALVIPMMAFGIKPGDEVIVPAFTFIATAETVSFLGAKPVFADIDPVTFNIDPKEIERKITDKTKGIIPVSLYGQCADFDEINKIAKDHNLWVIEDGAQSFGAEYKNKKSCSLTNVGTTSFFPAKPLGCFGDGGAVFTDDNELASKMRMILNHGQEKRYRHKYIGINGRLDTIQAAVVRVKLKYFSDEIKLRNKAAQTYSTNLSDIAEIPEILAHNRSTWAQYTIRVKKRDELQDFLKTKNIPTAVHYPVPLYRQEAFGNLKESPDNFPVSEKLSNEVMSLPMHPFLEKDDILYICSAVKEFYNG
ncbi:MAG: aminotransferase DegT [Deltaproteobacteria bacterium]|nr:MAG: aminotransferase DegT [Deltaproteobacteria bacterium]PIE74690.1 MAG: aminotransferase DegT [Deltaproteobacteria bacterium]